jgi:hypothetical protein
MSVEKFIRRNQIISLHIAQIAKHGKHLHWDSVLHPVDPQFREALNAQERLLTAVEQLLERLSTPIAA